MKTKEYRLVPISKLLTTPSVTTEEVYEKIESSLTRLAEEGWSVVTSLEVGLRDAILLEREVHP